MAHGSSSNRYQLIPLQAFPSLPKFTARKKHHSIPRWLYITALLVPVVVIGWILYKLAIVTNAFRTYEANPPVFAEPFRGKGIDAEPRAPEFPPWVVTDWYSVEATAWNVRKELNSRFHEMGLPDSSVGCEPIVSNLGIDPSLLQQRYSHLLAGGEPSPYVSDPQGFFFALNLFNAKAVIPHLFNTLLSISTLLGPSNVHISIFENGSWDETKDAMAHFARALTALGVAHTFRIDDHATDWAHVDRIEQLAIYRNVALEPILEYSPDKPPIFLSSRVDNMTAHPKLPTDLLFVNDIFLCPTDILELLHQRRFQGASASCGLDWREAPHGSMWGWLKGWLSKNYRFYDNWVTRSMEGFPLRPRVDMFGELRDGVRELFHWDVDTTYLVRWRAALPLPVYSCWNGIIALKARPFLPTTVPGGHGFAFRNGNAATGECAASECKLIARDFWGIGEKKWVLVPRVAVTYDEEAYPSEYLEKRVRRGGVRGMLDDIEAKKFRHAPSTAMELEEKINWDLVKDPERVVCFPFHRGDRLEIWPFYTEGSSVNSSIISDVKKTSPHIP